MKAKRMPTRSVRVQNMTRVVPSYTIDMRTGNVTSKMKIGWPKKGYSKLSK